MAVSRLHDLNKTMADSSADDAKLEREVKPIKANLEKLREAAKQLEIFHGDYIASNSKKKKAQVDQKNEEIAKLTEETKSMIERMTAETDRLRTTQQANEAELKVRCNVTISLSESLMDVTKSIQGMQEKHGDDKTSQVARRVKVRFTDKEGQQHISEKDAKQMAQQLLNANKQDSIFLQARAELEDALAQRDEVLELERSVIELHDMIKDLHRLVTMQHEQLELIAESAEKAETRTRKAVGDLEKAKKAQKSCVVS